MSFLSIAIFFPINYVLSLFNWDELYGDFTELFQVANFGLVFVFFLFQVPFQTFAMFWTTPNERIDYLNDILKGKPV